MKYTSSEANKLLRRLNEERDAVLAKEQKCSTFLAAMGEDPESLRPQYDYAAVQNTLEMLNRKIRTVRSKTGSDIPALLIMYTRITTSKPWKRITIQWLMNWRRHRRRWTP